MNYVEQTNMGFITWILTRKVLWGHVFSIFVIIVKRNHCKNAYMCYKCHKIDIKSRLLFYPGVKEWEYECWKYIAILLLNVLKIVIMETHTLCIYAILETTHELLTTAEVRTNYWSSVLLIKCSLFIISMWFDIYVNIIARYFTLYIVILITRLLWTMIDTWANDFSIMMMVQSTKVKMPTW